MKNLIIIVLVLFSYNLTGQIFAEIEFENDQIEMSGYTSISDFMGNEEFNSEYSSFGLRYIAALNNLTLDLKEILYQNVPEMEQQGVVIKLLGSTISFNRQGGVFPENPINYFPWRVIIIKEGKKNVIFYTQRYEQALQSSIEYVLLPLRESL